jgi:hypothetical protein
VKRLVAKRITQSWYHTHVEEFEMKSEKSESNPYLSSAIIGQESSQSLAPRPVSVWILLALGLVFFVTTSFGAVITFLRAFSHWNQVTDHASLSFALTWRLAATAVLLAILAGVWKRRKWARWLAMIMISTLTVALIIATEAQMKRIGSAFIGHLTIIPVVLACWLYRFGFATRSNRYFGRNDGPGA